MKRFLKVALVVVSVITGAIVMLMAFTCWLQKQLDEVFGNINLDFEEEETGVVPEVVKSKSEGG